jgi:superfamily II DNA/RNA helicase
MGRAARWHDEDIVLAPGLAGSVPQDRRRAEIARFKRDPDCRLFLSTDSGSVGLNLQIASSVINLDLPWNPAKLEQRIARAWRKNQMRTVDVINLVTEDSIEHVMLQVLSQKQALADGVLDGQDDLKAMKLPSGRRAFVERMSAMMAPPAAPVPTALTVCLPITPSECIDNGGRRAMGLM